ncbi:uncharacterized protein [Temnothorax nylanderi]|uniref:uncharacterized protein n=1 Tax=Temnothorax nylanderi TaxID=102681 RepID=UPI003A8BE3D1
MNINTIANHAICKISLLRSTGHSLRLNNIARNNYQTRNRRGIFREFRHTGPEATPCAFRKNRRSWICTALGVCRPSSIFDGTQPKEKIGSTGCTPRTRKEIFAGIK